VDKDKIIALLNQDFEGEHAAIIQYLTHAYAVGEGEMACEIEAIAREEMRHLDWLAETIVELGGVPSLKRGKMRIDGESVTNWMKNDMLLEEDAINPYKEHIKKLFGNFIFCHSESCTSCHSKGALRRPCHSEHSEESHRSRQSPRPKNLFIDSSLCSE